MTATAAALETESILQGDTGIAYVATDSTSPMASAWFERTGEEIGAAIAERPSTPLGGVQEVAS